MVRKITPEIEKFITANRTLSGEAIKDLISKKFKIVVTSRSVELYLVKVRAEAEADNAAKVEAVRAEVLGDAQRYVRPYLDILDREIKAWDALIVSGRQVFPKADDEKEAREIVIENVKDRSTASQSLQKCISSVLEFAKPPMEATVNVSIKPDLSKYTVDELRQLRTLAARARGV